MILDADAVAVYRGGAGRALVLEAQHRSGRRAPSPRPRWPPRPSSRAGPSWRATNRPIHLRRSAARWRRRCAGTARRAACSGSASGAPADAHGAGPRAARELRRAGGGGMSQRQRARRAGGGRTHRRPHRLPQPRRPPRDAAPRDAALAPHRAPALDRARRPRRLQAGERAARPPDGRRGAAARRACAARGGATYDFVARYGGDEFAIVAVDAHEDARVRDRRALDRPPAAPRSTTCSAGSSASLRDGRRGRVGWRDSRPQSSSERPIARCSTASSRASAAARYPRPTCPSGFALGRPFGESEEPPVAQRRRDRGLAERPAGGDRAAARARPAAGARERSLRPPCRL